MLEQLLGNYLLTTYISVLYLKKDNIVKHENKILSGIIPESTRFRRVFEYEMNWKKAARTDNSHKKSQCLAAGSSLPILCRHSGAGMAIQIF